MIAIAVFGSFAVVFRPSCSSYICRIFICFFYFLYFRFLHFSFSVLLFYGSISMVTFLVTVK